MIYNNYQVYFNVPFKFDFTNGGSVTSANQITLKSDYNCIFSSSDERNIFQWVKTFWHLEGIRKYEQIEIHPKKPESNQSSLNFNNPWATKYNSHFSCVFFVYVIFFLFILYNIKVTNRLIIFEFVCLFFFFHLILTIIDNKRVTYFHISIILCVYVFFTPLLLFIFIICEALAKEINLFCACIFCQFPLKKYLTG